jgi:hypothetical protein
VRPEPAVRVGELFRDARLPRWTWRVTGRFGELYRLERVDSPNVVRFPTLAVLRDDNRYVPLPPQAATAAATSAALEGAAEPSGSAAPSSSPTRVE